MYPGRANAALPDSFGRTEILFLRMWEFAYFSPEMNLGANLKIYRESFSGHPREMWHLAILTVINRMGTMVIPFLSVYLTTIKGFDFSEAGLLAAAFGLGSFAGAFLGGKITDRIGARAVIILSLLIGGVFLILLQLANTFWEFWTLIAVASLFGEAYRPALTTAVGYFVPKSKTGGAMALIRISIHLGMSIAPAVGGFAAAQWGYEYLFWFDGGTCIAGSLYFAWISRNWRHSRRAEDQSEDSGQPHREKLPPYQNFPYLRYLLATFLVGISFVQIFHSLPVFLKSSWGFDERFIGILMASSSLITILVEMPVVYSIEKRKKNRTASLLGAALIVLTFTPLFLPQGVVFPFISMLLWTFGAMLFLPFNGARALHSAPAGLEGSYMAYYWMTWSLCNVLGPSLGLAFIGEFGYNPFWLLLLGLGLVSLLIYARLPWKQPEANA